MSFGAGFRTVIFIVALAGGIAEACTVIAVGPGASSDGSTINSQTVDGMFDSNITFVPGGEFPDGAKADVMWGLTGQSTKPPKKIGQIPQVRRTYGYFHVGYPFMNTHQLTLGESTIAQHARLKASRKSKAIMTIEQLQVFALQRTKTARGAIRLMGALAEKYGFLGSYQGHGESLTVADGKECWLFEVFGVGALWDPAGRKPGAIWAARRIPDDHVFCMANLSRIRQIDLSKPDQFMASAGHRQPAIDNKWWDPAGGKPFVWQEAYTPPKGGWSLTSAFTRNRLYMFSRTFAPSRNWPLARRIADYPFSIKPEKKVSVRDVIALMRSTFKGTPLDVEADPNWKGSRLATPYPSTELCRALKVRYRRPIAVRDCSHGFVARSRPRLPDSIGAAGWFFLDNPHTSCFVPIYAGVTSFPKSWRTYDRRQSSRDSARWAFAQIDNMVARRYQDNIRELRRVRDPLENEFFANSRTIEAAALEAHKRSPAEAARILTEFANASMALAEKTYWDLIDKLIAKYDDR